MPRTPRTPRPSGRQIKASVFRGLGMNSGLTAAMVPTLQFSPSIGIAAGRIDKLGMDIRSFREPLTRAVREVIVPSIRENFDAGGRPAWEPLADATLALRQSRGISGSKPLTVSGALRRGASQINIWDIRQNSAVIPDLPQKVWYGKIHQAGYSGNSMTRRIEQFGGDRKRALESLLDDQLDIIQKATLGRTTGKLKGAGKRQYRITASPGGTMGGGGVSEIPARPFLIFQPDDEDAVTEVFINWLEERVNAAWPGGMI